MSRATFALLGQKESSLSAFDIDYLVCNYLWKKKKMDSANIIQLNLNITKSLRLALIYFVEILFDQSFAPSVQKLNVHLVVVSTRS